MNTLNFINEFLASVFGGGYGDWERAFELIKELGLYDEFAEEIRESFELYGEVDPVATAYEVIIKKSEYSDFFSVYGNYLASSVSVEDSFFKELIEEHITREEELDDATRFLLKEAGIDFEEKLKEFLEEEK